MTAPAGARKTASRAQAAEQQESEAERSTTTTKRAKSASQSGTATRSRSAGAERAYARRDQRRDRSAGEALERRPRARRLPLARPRPQLAVKPKAKQIQAKMAVSRVPFVVAVMAVLATGLVATLWLSIATVSGSYELRQGKAEINALNEKSERLMRENNYLSSPTAMQHRAAEWGWVPVEDPPHLTWNPDGSPRVVGEPKVAQAPPAPPPQQPAQQPPGQPTQQLPEQAAQQPAEGRIAADSPTGDQPRRDSQPDDSGARALAGGR